MSYVQENRIVVTRLVHELRAAGLSVWFDQDALTPGVFWRDAIRAAVRDHEFFLCCFSNEYLGRRRTYMNEELEIAIEEIRLRASAPWFIPVVLSGEVPDRPIGAGRTLRDIQAIDLSESRWSSGVESLLRALSPRHSDVGSSESIAAAIAQESGDDWSGISLNSRILLRFLNESRIARHLDVAISANASNEALHEAIELSLEPDVDALAVAGISTTTQLERALIQHKTIILAFAEEWLGHGDTQVSQGISLTFLGYIIFAARNDPAGLLKFMAAARIHVPEASVAQRVIATYERVLGKTA